MRIQDSQVRIYRGKIVHNSGEYIRARLAVYESLETPMDLNELRQLLPQAEKNQELINDAIEQTRKFIKNEFSFKDSF